MSIPPATPATPSREPDYSSKPSLVPTPLAKKIYTAFAKAASKTTTTEQPIEIKRSILVQKGITAKAVNVFVKAILGEKLHRELKSLLRDSQVTILAEKMGNDSVTESDLKGFSSQEVARAHLQVRACKPETTECKPLAEWHALRFEKGEVITNQVYTTSERALSSALNRSPSLTNIYVKISDTGEICITCGVIDTKEKADAFIAAVRWAQEKRAERKLPAPPLRISMHQLNSMGVGPGVFVAEKALVTRQHELVTYINHTLSPDGPPIVSHTNRCLNGFTQIRGEDAKSHSLNQEGLALQMRWVFEDVKTKLDLDPSYKNAQIEVNRTLTALQKKHAALFEKENEHPELKKELDFVNEQICEIILNDLLDLGPQNSDEKKRYDSLMRKKEELESKVTEIKTLKKEVQAFEKQLEKQNKTLCKAMHQMSLCATGDEKVKLQLATRILASQTGMNKELQFETLSPVQELALMLLLDQVLGLVTEINCKSGLDRTAFARSLQTVLQMKVKVDGFEKTFAFICEFEKNVKLMDSGRLEDSKKSAVVDFQQKLLHELKEVAIPITWRSTGLRGLKWHWTVKTLNPFQKNPHPVNWLPISPSSKGKRTVPTELARELCGLSPERGG